MPWLCGPHQRDSSAANRRSLRTMNAGPVTRRVFSRTLTDTRLESRRVQGGPPSSWLSSPIGVTYPKLFTHSTIWACAFTRALGDASLHSNDAGRQVTNQDSAAKTIPMNALLRVLSRKLGSA